MRDLPTSTTLVLSVLGLLCAGCSSESEKPKPENTLVVAPREDRTAALAQQYNFSLLSKELKRTVGTNTAYSIDIQRVFAGNKRVVATGTLRDIVQSGEQLQAIFEIETLDLLPWEGTCIAILDCPTNIITRLCSEEVLPTCAVAFEVTGNHHALKFSSVVVNEHEFTKPWSVITVEGKLFGFEKLY